MHHTTTHCNMLQRLYIITRCLAPSCCLPALLTARALSLSLLNDDMPSGARLQLSQQSFVDANGEKLHALLLPSVEGRGCAFFAGVEYWEHRTDAVFNRSADALHQRLFHLFCAHTIVAHSYGKIKGSKGHHFQALHLHDSLDVENRRGGFEERDYKCLF
eukprot:CAMPEP_0173083508 /NCGR_PEP_ID=MMETSP1102-20130122/19503_1 /TAXON_ID=49646 /ORGANISM="Geminigera sp., Strain Caron Lab Isolate" /LENGTH=159 /DNA_ID=CAMNT_0013960479 /DNA_START=156 /DNA_END=633 /DNA_ORIENTATION=+